MVFPSAPGGRRPERWPGFRGSARPARLASGGRQAMRAIVCRELIGPDGLTLEDWPVPEPGPGEVRIRVRAAGLNFADTLLIKGQYQDKPPLPFVPGIEIAGQIEQRGEGVAGFLPGDRVMATLDHGGFAEEAVTAAS